MQSLEVAWRPATIDSTQPLTDPNGNDRRPFACEPDSQPEDFATGLVRLPSVYHLHPSPSRPVLGVATPPALPARTIETPNTYLTKADMAGTTCNCGHELFDARGCCPACYERQQRRHQRLSGRESFPAASPPPSQLGSPRHSGERSRLPSIAESSYMPSPAVAAINSAFTDEARGRAEVNLFPSHLYQTPRRSSPRKSESSERPQRTQIFRHSEDHVGPIVSQLQDPPTPRGGSSSPTDRVYSPIGAGFARMSLRDSREDRELVNEKRLSQRESIDLAVRMFDGPA